MPNLETPPELAEVIANEMDIYGACSGEGCNGLCRPHFTAATTQRIREAVANENLLNGGSSQGKEGKA